jgi:hypothetical protein
MEFPGVTNPPPQRESRPEIWRDWENKRRRYKMILKEAGLTHAMNHESVRVNFPETDKGIKIVR